MAPDSLLVTDVAVVDVEAGTVRSGQDVEIRHGRIAEVRAAGRVGADLPRLDGRGMFALPGLIDAHVHALGTYVEHIRPLDAVWFPRQMRRNLRRLLRSGVTTIRDLGAPTRLVRRFAQNAAEHRLESPRILWSGAILCAAGGYPTFIAQPPAPVRWLLGDLRIDLRTPVAAEAAVDRLVAAGAHVIKALYSSRGYDDAATPLPLLADDVLCALAQRAALHGRPLAVHHTWLADLERLLELPFDTLEHLPIDAPMTEAHVARIAERRLPVTTTLMTYGIASHFDELAALCRQPDGPFEPRAAASVRAAIGELRQGRSPSPAFGVRVAEVGTTHARDSLRRLHMAGARLVLGTDSGGAITPCGHVAWELEDMVDAGLSPQRALAAATVDAAAALGRPELGRIAPGAVGDLVLVRTNPLDSVSALRRVVHVVRDGRAYAGG